MVNAITEFNERVKEVESYFTFLDKLDKKNPKLFFPLNKTRQYQNIDVELMKILKANAFLILYNLVESAVKNSLDAIYDELKTKGVSFDTIKETFKKLVLNNLKGSNVSEILDGMTDLSIEIIFKTYSYDKSISGNIDARKFRDLAKMYGFSDIVNVRARGGVTLLTVKNNRNNLAHGTETFSECGRRYSVDDLMQVKNEVIIYVRCIMNNIKKYLVKTEYLM